MKVTSRYKHALHVFSYQIQVAHLRNDGQAQSSTINYNRSDNCL